MRAAINVQHLDGDLARLGEIEHGLCDVLGARNLPKRLQCAQELLGVVLVQRVSTTPGATTFTRRPCGAYSMARLREIASIPPLVIIGTDAVAVGPGFQSPVCWNVLSGCARQLIRWETLESNFQKWQSDPHGEPRRCPDIRQSGPVREHQPGSPLAGYADLDGEPAVIGAGVEARRVAAETHNATGDPNCAGTRIFQSVQGAADPSGR